MRNSSPVTRRSARRAAEYDPEFAQLRDDIAPLDAYYIPTRYPNGLPDNIPARVYTRAAAEETLRMADHALAFVKARFGPESS